MSYLPKRYLYMLPGSYALVPTCLFERDMAQRDPATYAVLSDGMTAWFRKPVTKELRDRFVRDYEEYLRTCSVDGFD